jgi:hypothetical protein
MASETGHAVLDKRRRNARPSKYRKRTEAQKARRKELWEARAHDRKTRHQTDHEAELNAQLQELEAALRDHGHDGVHRRRNTRPLEDITDDAERFAVLKARVERMEALWSVDRRKRETRGKIILGGALLAEVIEAVASGDRTLLAGILDILDRRVDAPRDRLTLKALLGDAPLPLRPGGDLNEPLEDAILGDAETAPDFDALVQCAMAEETFLTPSDIDADYADLDDRWSLQL